MWTELHAAPSVAGAAPYVATCSLTSGEADAQKHFLCTMPGPLSSYSSFFTHMLWKVDSEDRIDPPIHTEYFRSGGATTLIFIEFGARLVTSLDRRSAPC